MHDARASERFEPLAVGLLAALLYAATGAHDVLWGDPAKLAQAAYDCAFSLDPQAHFGNSLWARLFALLPLESYAWRTQLASAAAGGIAFGLGYSVLLELGLSRAAARIGIAAAVCCHTIWFVSAMTESYSAALALLGLAAWLARVRQRPLLAGLVLGAGFLVHVICLFSLPALVHALWSGRGGRASALRAAAGAALGCGVPALAVFLLASRQPGGASSDWVELTRLYSDWRLPAHNAPLLLGYFAYNFAGPALVFCALGLRRMDRAQLTTGLLLAAAHYAVALFWIPQRSYLIAVPVYYACALPIALGAEATLAARAPWRTLLATIGTPVLVYFATPWIVDRLPVQPHIRDVPFRSEANYFYQPWKCGESGARRSIEAVGSALPERALVVGDFSTLTPLWYAQRVEGWRADLELYTVDQRSSEQIEARLETAREHGQRIFVLDRETLGRIPGAQEHVDVAGVEQLSELVARR
jgi:hypothetical protein